MKQIWTGPVLNGHRERLLDLCSQRIAEGRADSFIYLCAARPLLDVVTLDLIERTENAAAWGPLPVYLFRLFVRRILAETVTKDGSAVSLRASIDSDDTPIRLNLVWLLLQELEREGKLEALGSFVGNEGCSATVLQLLGELYRAGIAPDEFRSIVALKAQDNFQMRADDPFAARPNLQQAFDRDIATVYESYHELLNNEGRIDQDSEQLRALWATQGELDGREVNCKWFDKTELLIIDGFYDFTPIQGAILKHAVRRIPNVILNLNGEPGNPEIFRPFEETMGLFQSVADFEIIGADEHAGARTSSLKELPTRLFNSSIVIADSTTEPKKAETGSEAEANGIEVLNCSDPETEISEVAKIIKRLVLREGYSYNEIALVARHSSQYVQTVKQIFENEQIPFDDAQTVCAADIAAAGAVISLLKLFQEAGPDGAGSLEVSSILTLVKSGYLNFSSNEHQREPPPADAGQFPLAFVEEIETNPSSGEAAKEISTDELGNAIFFVGRQLRIQDWLARARRLDANSLALLNQHSHQDEGEDNRSVDESFGARSRPRQSSPVRRPFDGTLLTAAARSVAEFSELIDSGLGLKGAELISQYLRKTLDVLGFGNGIGPFTRLEDSSEFRSRLLELQGVIAVRRAIDLAVESFTLVERERTAVEGAIAPSIAQFSRIVISTLQRLTVLLPRGERQGIKLFSATDVRGLRFRALFLVGLNEGTFPARPRHDWIYPHEERQRLRELGLVLEDTSPDALLKEEHYFYQSVCRATERLYLSQPAAMSDGAEAIESYYISELKHALSPLNVKTRKIRPSYALEGSRLCSTPAELALTAALAEFSDSGVGSSSYIPGQAELLSEYVSAAGYRSNETSRKFRVAIARAGMGYGAFDGLIDDDDLKGLIRSRFREKVLSAGQLSLYGKCPFKYFVSRLLGLEAAAETTAELSALDSGILSHEILRRFFVAHRGESLQRTELPSLRHELRSIADEVFDAFEVAVPPISPKMWNIEREIQQIVLSQFLDDEIKYQESTAQCGMVPKYFELSFGSRGGGVDPLSTNEYLSFEREGVGKIRVQGRIDRIDESRDGTLVVYDYKSSSVAKREDMESGRELQMEIYLQAIEKLFFKDATLAGAGYYVIKGTGKRNQGLYRSGLSSYTGIGKTLSNLSDQDWINVRNAMTDRVWDFWSNMGHGGFEVAPTAPGTTCKSCDYSSLCRYDLHRIRSKMNARRSSITRPLQ